MRIIAIGLLAATAFVGACTQSDTGNEATNAEATAKPTLSLTRLDCGSATIKNFDAFFHNTPITWTSKVTALPASG